MPVARTHSIALVGVEGYPVEIESDIENGVPGLLLVGLPDTALREARDRIRAAIINSHEQWPQRRITVGLSPASLPKRGSGFDLGIALSILAAAGAVPPAAIDGVVFLGELGLDGRVRPVRGVLPAMASAGCAGFGKAVVAQPNAEEAALVPGLRVAGAATLAGLLAWLRGELEAEDAGVVCAPDGNQSPDRPAMPGGAPPRAGREGGGSPATAGKSGPPGAVPAGPFRGARPAHRSPGSRDLRRRRSSPVAARPARRGQDHAGRTAAHRHARAGPGSRA